MLYVKAVAGGLLTLFVAAVAGLYWLARRSYPAQVGFSPSVFLEPGILRMIVGVFALGFCGVLVLLKR